MLQIISFIIVIIGPILVIGFVINKNIKEDEKKRLGYEENIIQYVQNNIIKNKCNQVKYIHYFNGKHTLNVKVENEYYELILEKINGYNEYSYTYKKHSTGPIDTTKEGGIQN